MKKFLPLFFLILFFCCFKPSSVLAITKVEEVCQSILKEERDSRPAACYVCNQNELLTPACATSFKVRTGVSYNLWEGPDFEVPWDRQINISPIAPTDDLKIPFVGMKKQESENKYLADYLEGTNEYYQNYGNQTTLTNYQGVLRKLTPYEYQNQLKKQLIARAPEENLVKENPINDYQVIYTGRLCWDTPFWMDAGRLVFNEFLNLIMNSPINAFKDIFINQPIALFNSIFKTNIAKVGLIDIEIGLPDIGHYCLYADQSSSGIAGWAIVKGLNFFHLDSGLGKLQEILAEASQKIPGLVHFSSTEMLPTVIEPLSAFTNHMPPDPTEENYREDYLAWKKSGPSEGYWYRLWQVVPMLSREDTKGEIIPYLAEEDEKNMITFTAESATISSIPHLARLYEGSKIINDVLIPAGEEGKLIEMVKSAEIPETDPPFTCFKEDYILTQEGDNLCCSYSVGNERYFVTGTLNAVEVFTDPGFYSNRCNCLYEVCTPPITTEESSICNDDYIQTAYRNIGVNLKHPYLDEIWSYMANAKGGFFNIFRPQSFPAFEDIDAAQAVSYLSPDFETEEIAPNQGLFFFPHLGGIQKAKEWVVNQALKPYQSSK